MKLHGILKSSYLLIILLIIFSWAISNLVDSIDFLPKTKKAQAANSTLTTMTCYYDDLLNITCQGAISADGGTAFAVTKGSHFDAPLQTLSTGSVTSATFYYDHGPSVVSGTWQIYVTDTRDGSVICSIDPAVENSTEITSNFSCNSITSAQLSGGVWVRVVGENDKGPEDVSIDYLRLSVNHNASPNNPTNQSPADGATGVSINPSLTGSSYSDSDGDPHSDTEWILSDNSFLDMNGKLGTSVWSRAAGTGETTTTVNSTNGTFEGGLSGETSLASNTTYHWQTRYYDGASWSLWSGSTSFTTESSANVLPETSSVSIDSGASAITLNEGTTKNVSCVGTVTDADGFADITSVKADFFRTSRTISSALDANDHYQLSGDTECVPSGGSGNSETYTCTFAVEYFADPTDASSPNSADNWTCTMTPSDSAGSGTTASDTIEMNSLIALDVTSSINYGTLNPGDSWGTLGNSASTTVTNTGNRDMDPQISGTDMASGGNTIPVGQQHYSDDSLADYSVGTALSGTPTTYNLTLPQRTASIIEDFLYWGIEVPSGTQTGTYTGTNTFTATQGI